MSKRGIITIARFWIVGLMVGGWLLANGSLIQTAQAGSRIQDMPVFAQQRGLSCEYAATRSAVARWGIQLSEEDFINGIGFDANPHIAFRGDINGWWGGTDEYGIYPEPIARFLATRGLNTKLLWDGIPQLKEELDYGRPVVVWITGGLMTATPFEASAAGQNFLLMPYEHAVTLYGYDDNGVYVADPGFGTYGYYDWANFSRSWGYLRNMAMSVWPASQGAIPAERPGIAPQYYRYWLMNSGLELMGQPITTATDDSGKISQYFERARLEYDNAQPATQPIQRSLLGRALAKDRLQEDVFQPLSTDELDTLSVLAKSRYYAETGHIISPDFSAFWLYRGSLEAFGYPISRPFVENGVQVQYFERVRMEIHPDSIGQPTVKLGLLGSELLQKGGK